MDRDTTHAGILDALPFPLFACDDRMRILYMNPACEQLAGTTLDDARGRRWDEVIGEAGTSFTSLPGAKGIVGIVERYPRRATGAPEEPGVPSTGEAHAESEKRFRELADFLPEVVFEADVLGRITYANRRAFQLFGYTESRLAAGISIFDLIMPGELERVAQNWKKRTEGGTVGPVEYRLRRADGSDFPGLINVAPVVAGDAITGMRGVVIDISKQKEAEDALRQSEARFRALTESTPAIIYIYQDGKMQYVNPAAEKVFGYSAQELQGRDILGRAIHRDSLGLVIARMTARDRGEPVNSRYEVKIVTKSGEERVLDLSSNPIEYNGRPAVIGSAFDVTEARKMEEEILNTRKLESLGVLAGGIAHDFNNLLTVIIGNVSLAKINLPGEHPASRCLVEAEEASMRARDLTNQLLTFSRGGSPVKKTASVEKLLRDTIRFTLSGSSLLPVFSIADNLWDADIDEGQISQVINNIAMNASQASPEGGSLDVTAENLELDASHDLPLQPGRYIRISFTDHGTGIPADILPKVFDPYFTTKRQGSGLGLTTSYSIVRKHNGHIALRSRPGEGSTFSIYLPASTGNAGSAPEKPAPSPRRRGKILILDDDAAVLNVAKNVLAHLGYDSVCVRSGAQAVHAYTTARHDQAPFDAVILDLTIPGGMGAVETVNALAKIDPNVAALVSSGYVNDPVMAEHERHGFRGTITKPYDIGEIARTLGDLIGER